MSSAAEEQAFLNILDCIQNILKDLDWYNESIKYQLYLDPLEQLKDVLFMHKSQNNTLEAFITSYKYLEKRVWARNEEKKATGE